MKTNKSVMVFAALFAAIFFCTLVNAAGSITSVEVNGIDVTTGEVIAGTYRDSLPVRVEFVSTSAVEDARVHVWFSGASSSSAVTSRMDILPNVIYSKMIALAMPDDFSNDATEERYTLNVVVESKSTGEVASKEVSFSIQRESYAIEILDVEMDTKANAGDIMPVNVVVKNRGRNFADDAFVSIKIPVLGVEDRAYLGDLSPVDQGGDVVEKEDAREVKLYLKMPSNAPQGIYVAEISAFNDDSVDKVSKKVVLENSGADSNIVAPIKSKSAAVGEVAEYSIVIANAGKSLGVYEIVVENSDNVNAKASESAFAIPAGAVKEVKVTASSNKEGTYTFRVNVHSNGAVVKSEMLGLKVEGKKATDTVVLLTVVLAIIFVVLLIVLIVLLTKKSNKGETESYY